MVADGCAGTRDRRGASGMSGDPVAVLAIGTRIRYDDETFVVRGTAGTRLSGHRRAR